MLKNWLWKFQNKSVDTVMKPSLPNIILREIIDRRKRLHGSLSEALQLEPLDWMAGVETT